MTVAYTPTASFQTAGTETVNACYKDVTVTVGDGDKIVAFGCSENANGSGTAALATQSGSTGTWTVSASNNANQTPGFVMGWADASAAGSVTVRVTVPTSGGASQMGAGVWVIPAGQWSGTPAVTTMAAHDLDGQVSVTLSATSTVIYGGADWSALAPGGAVTPSGTADSNWSDGVHYAGLLADWTAQASGTRVYGPNAAAGDDWIGAVLVIQGDASGGGGGTQQTTGALYASGTPTTGQSNGSWATPTNATGAPNAARAVWTSTGSGATGWIIPAGYGAQAAIGSAPASVDQVSVTVYAYTSNTTRMASIAVQLTDNGTLFGSPQTMTKSTTTTFSQTFTFTGVTWAQLANLGVRVLYTRGAVTTSATGNVDAISIDVTYTPTSLTPVSITRDISYRVLGQVIPTRAVSWNTKATISPATRVLAWDVLTVVTPISRVASWRTLAPVQTVDRAVSWRLLASVIASRVLAWDVAFGIPVSTTRQVRFNVLAGTTATRQARWNTLAQTEAQRVLRWNALSQTAIASRQMLWDVLTGLATTRAAQWHTLAGLSTPRSVLWRTLATVAPVQRQLAWRVLAGLQIARVVRYDVQGNLTSVVLSRVLRWDTQAYIHVTVTRDVRWAILREVTPVLRQVAWDTLRGLSVDRETRWRLSQAVALDRAVAWEVRALAQTDREVRWHTLAALPSAVDRVLLWSVAAAAYGPGSVGLHHGLRSTGPDGRLRGGTPAGPIGRGIAAGTLARWAQAPGLHRGG